jgi:hypothetical protein
MCSAQASLLLGSRAAGAVNSLLDLTGKTVLRGVELGAWQKTVRKVPHGNRPRWLESGTQHTNGTILAEWSADLLTNLTDGTVWIELLADGTAGGDC